MPAGGARRVRIGTTHRHKATPARSPEDSEDEKEQKEKDLAGAAQRGAHLLDLVVLASLGEEGRKAQNNKVSSVLREAWRIDCFRPQDAPSFRYEICRNYNHPCGPGWCQKDEESRDDVPGHKGTIPGCTRGNKWSVHGCCRCGEPGHPYTACTVPDADLPLNEMSGATMPGREATERKEVQRWKKEKYYGRDAVPQQTNWSSGSRSSGR